MHLVLKKVNYTLYALLFLILYTSRCASIEDRKLLELLSEAEKDNADAMILRTGRDVELLDEYTRFLKSKYPVQFIVVAAFCIVIGLAGNAGFLQFFGRKTEQIYFTRDAVYFRCLSYLDLSVLLIVLPYAMCFETKLLTNNIACKMMEFLRHMIFYMNHICLVAYSMEIPRRYGFTTTNRHIIYVVMTSFVLGLSCSMPVLVLFGVGSSENSELILTSIFKAKPRYSNQTKTGEIPLQYFEPEYCHMTFNYKTKSPFYAEVQLLRLVYYGLNAALFASCTVVYVCGIIKYMSPSRGMIEEMKKRKQSMRDVRASQVEIPEEYSIQAKKRSSACSNHAFHLRPPAPRKNSASLLSNRFRDYYKPKHSSNLYTIYEYENGRHESNASLSKEQIASLIRIRNGNKNSHSIGTETKSTIGQAKAGIGTHPQKQHQSKRKDSPPASLSNMRENLAPSGRRKSIVHDTDLDIAAHELFMKTSNSKPAGDDRELEEAKRQGRAELVLEQKNAELMGAKRSQRPSVTAREAIRLTGRKPLLPMSSYKIPLMLLIFMDLFIIALGVILYETSASSTVLNLIHIKSVISFYVISAINNDLRKAVWGNVCPMFALKRRKRKNSTQLASSESGSSSSLEKNEVQADLGIY